MRGSKLVWMLILVIFLAVMVSAQNQPQTTIKNVPVKNTSPTSGKEMYNTYCAVCHAVDGRGNGPAAEALKVPPTDLTMLSKNNSGKFPDMKVVAAIRGESNLPAHGKREMPIWGQLFFGLSHGHEGEVQQRTANLTKYIESLQAK
jgi:mono/diheme cytochrome c family protein